MSALLGVMIRLGWRAGVILACALLAGCVTYVVRATADPIYAATTRVVITPNVALLAGDSADLIDSVAALDRPVINATVSELLQSGSTAEMAAAAIGLPAAAIDLYEFNAAEVAGSAVIRLRITGPDLETTRQLAQAVRDSPPPLVQASVGVFEIRTIDQTEIGAVQISPNPLSDAFAVGLAVGLALLAGSIVITARREMVSSSSSSGNDG